MPYSVQTTARKLCLSIAALLTCLSFVPVLAAAAQQSSGTIAQGFQTNIPKENLKAGALVSFTKGNPNAVELATSDTAVRIAGVIDQLPLVAISTSSEKVQVVLNGTTTVLVSDINGAVKSSDKITASPIAGVGMRATSDSQVVGTAQADFKLSGSETQSIKDKAGKTHTVHIGYVPLQVGVAYYQAPGSNFLPPFLQNIANSIAGRPTSLIRILLASLLLLLGFVIMSVLIYSAVRSSVTSLGRNPLAANAIHKGLFQSGIAALVIFAVTLLGSYIILRV